MPATTLLTLALDATSQARFEKLRRQHYPPELNRIPAHLSLFHTLPDTNETAAVLREAAAATTAFSIAITGVRSLGRGVAYIGSAPGLMRLHTQLSQRFASDLTAQDRQRFQPHIVVQNKVAPAQAKELLAFLQASFVPGTSHALGLVWWEYLGGPWRLIEQFSFLRGKSPA